MESEMDLSTKAYVVTGATSGIRLATAEALVRAGADVMGLGRSLEWCRQAEARLRSLARGNQVDYLLANLSVQAGWLTLATAATLTGDLTFLGSVANFIVAEIATRWRIVLKFLGVREVRGDS